MTIEQDLKHPFNDHLGIEFKEWEAGYARITAEVRDEFTNSHGLPHGGFLCSLLDVAAALPGIYCPYPGRTRRALTLSLDTQFVGQPQSRELYAIGKLTKSGNKIFFSSAEVFDSHDNLLAMAQAILKYRSGSESSEGVSLQDWQQQSR